MKRTAPWNLYLLVLLMLSESAVCGQTASPSKVERGSLTAKNGFKNETEIAAKLNSWRTDDDAKNWLTSMNYKLDDIENVLATKPHGEKADVEVRVKTKKGEKTEGISIKLVSSPNGFNQIDKRWLSHYAKMWKMPAGVEATLRYFLGEVQPLKPGRDPKRMYLNELDSGSQKAVIDFFTANKAEIVSDLFQGDGIHAAGWMMVALKATENTRWVLHPSADAIKFFGEGRVEITRAGNLKIGRITMQRKGGDGGRDTAKMLQFKINPVQLFNAK
ncbi:MAG: type II restriction endonuclease [Pyrinomonadaceae bacterium]